MKDGQEREKLKEIRHRNIDVPNRRPDKSVTTFTFHKKVKMLSTKRKALHREGHESSRKNALIAR